MNLAHGEPVTRQRGTATFDPYSNEVTSISWTDPDEAVIPGWAVEPVQASETLEDQVSIDLRLYGPYGADVKPLDRVVVRGETFSVEGARADWRNPYTGDEPGCAVECRRVAG